MKGKLSMLGALFALLLASFLDNSTSTNQDSLYYNIMGGSAVDANVQSVQKSSFTSYEFILEDMKEVDDYIVETYRRYEVHKDEKGDVIIRIPTSNFQYLKYKK